VATYSIYQTKARLSEVLRLVKTRREVVITERGKPIAKIVPFEQADEESLDQRIDYLAATGQLIPATIAPGDSLPSTPTGPKGKSPKVQGALQRFLAERDE
jgi:prevent-host-death family protein